MSRLTHGGLSCPDRTLCPVPYVLDITRANCLRECLRSLHTFSLFSDLQTLVFVKTLDRKEAASYGSFVLGPPRTCGRSQLE
ncbi:hypothetical protein TNCV_3012221 [Trichonephila clavipes]|nr:hypothetical protein TNCV_3012221 [Trichonephila clavipes]